MEDQHTGTLLRYFILLVIFRTCSALSVTIGNVGDVVEGSETRMVCNIVKEVPFTGFVDVSWLNITNGTSDTISSFFLGEIPTLNPSYDARFEIDSEATLIINSTVRTDSGIYRCEAIDIHFIERPPEDSDDVTLNVIYISGALTLADPASHVCFYNFSCTGSITAHSTPDINLYKDDEIIATQTTLPLIRLISNVVGDSGTYRCEANNTAGRVVSNDVTQHSDLQFDWEIDPQLIVYSGVTVTVHLINTNFETNDVSIQWTTVPPIDDVDNNKATFTFVAEEDDTIYTFTVTIIAECSRKLTKSLTITVLNYEPCQCDDTGNSVGLIIGMIFVVLPFGVVGTLLVQFAHKNVKLAQGENTKNANSNTNTYMEYSQNSRNENQIYQDLDLKEEPYEDIGPFLDVR